MARNQNIFKAGGEATFAVPQSAFDRLLLSEGVQHSAVVLYAYLLRHASGPVSRLHVGQIQEMTGMSRQTYLTARNQLRDEMRLIACRETARRGFWEFEFLNDGRKLATYGSYVKFSDLTPTQIEAFYANRLDISRAPGQDASGDLHFVCPFHVSMKAKPTMRVTASGGDHQGRFICGNRRCGKRGGLLDFEQRLAAINGMTMSRQEAIARVTAFFTEEADREQARSSLDVSSIASADEPRALL